MIEEQFVYVDKHIFRECHYSKLKWSVPLPQWDVTVIKKENRTLINCRAVSFRGSRAM